MNRRQFVKLGAGAVAVLATGAGPGKAAAGPSKPRPTNIVLIYADQQHIDTIAAGGCRHVRTPALDRLKRSGISFAQSYSANPLCSPARSAVFTGRTSCECGVHVNGRPIRTKIPNLGQWLSQHTDLEPFYAGKWHLPRSYSANIPGFNVINTGIGGFGYFCDTMVSRACEGFLRNRSRSKPFLLVASFLQPHDICEWLRLNMENPAGLRYPQLAGHLPELPDNFEFDKREPQTISRMRLGNEPFKGKAKWDKQQWRYYRWSYYRNIEQLDAEIGRILQALDECGYAKDTLVVMSADHGEGMGHHQMVRKSSFYNEASRVPLIFSWPGHIAQDRTDTIHPASGLDIMPTLCDYTGIEPPPNMRGISLRPALEANGALMREFIVSEVSANAGRMVRTPQYKFICYAGDPVEQLFDMTDDPGETDNLAAGSGHGEVLARHRRLLKSWEDRLDVAAGIPRADAWQAKT